MTDARLEDKTALVIGASRGIGLAIAEGLAQGGAAVVGGSRTSSAAAENMRLTGGRVCETHLDVTSEPSVGRVFAALDAATERLDIVVYNAGIGVFGPLEDIDVRDFQRVIDTNLTGAFRCCRRALTRMKRQGGGRIIAIGSIADRVALPGSAAYAASKFGLRALAETITEEGKSAGVFASLVSPGAVDTALWVDRPGFERSDMLRASDIADAVVEIAARSASVRVDEVRLMPPKGIL